MRVDSAKLVRRSEPRNPQASALGHFGSAYRHACDWLWRDPKLYRYEKTKGFTSQTWSESVINRIAHGSLRTISLQDHALVETCKELAIPCSYKGIELFLGRFK